MGECEPLSGATLRARGPESDAARRIWAKSSPEPSASLPLWRHIADSAICAAHWADHFLPNGAGALSTEETRRLATFLAAFHDIGKCTFFFQNLVPELSDWLDAAGLGSAGFDADSKNTHALFSAAILIDVARREGVPPRSINPLAAVLAGHHGRFPSSGDLVDTTKRLARHSDAWHRVIRELVDFAEGASGVTLADAATLARRATKPDLIVLTAIVILADWTASNTDDFPIARTLDEVADPRSADERARDAWDRMNLPERWMPIPASIEGTDFAHRFALPQTARPRPIQTAMLGMARQPGTRLILLEAPMGSGKTEAALLAAEALAADAGKRGVAVLLPTMATSDAMFDRTLDWLTGAGTGDASSVFLAHSRRDQNRRFESIGRASRQYRIHDDSGAVTIEALSKRKTGLFSDFVVGTIDQLLMGALASSHVVLRHLAFSSKVVIVDEVHSADEYMSEFLDRALAWLGRHGVPTILLSATLPPERRDSLVQAYRSGIAGSTTTAPLDRDTRAPGLSRMIDVEHGTPSPVPVDAYPRMTALVSDEVRIETPAGDGRRLKVMLERADDDHDTLVDLLTARLAHGGCAVVIRNTVTRCISTAQALAADTRLDAEIIVAHARFTASDRAQNDEALLRLFDGRERDDEGFAIRPWADSRPRIVVATSVVEQSLDIDFDLLVTDVAPVDLLLQRIGRLHRHPRRRPGLLREARCVITGVTSWADTPPTIDEQVAKIHGPYRLLRALAVLLDNLDGRLLDLPRDIPRLVREAWEEPGRHPADWGETVDDARSEHLRLVAERRASAAAFLIPAPHNDPRAPLFGFATISADPGTMSAETREQTTLARVRDGVQTAEAILVIETAPGELIPAGRAWNGDPVSAHYCPGHASARALASSVIRLPVGLSTDAAVRELEQRSHFAAWQESALLKGRLLLVLDADGAASLVGHTARYDTTYGLITVSKKGTAL